MKNCRKLHGHVRVMSLYLKVINAYDTVSKEINKTLKTKHFFPGIPFAMPECDNLLQPDPLLITLDLKYMADYFCH